jgi:hypothetical protein
MSNKENSLRSVELGLTSRLPRLSAVGPKSQLQEQGLRPGRAKGSEGLRLIQKKRSSVYSYEWGTGAEIDLGRCVRINWTTVLLKLYMDQNHLGGLLRYPLVDSHLQNF